MDQEKRFDAGRKQRMNILTSGARLKKIRLEKGLSLEDAQKKTRINLNILKAIEGESASDLSPIYLKGFLKIYAKFLGVDPKDYISDYKESIQGAQVVFQKESTPAIAKPPQLDLSSFRITRKMKQAAVLVIAAILVMTGLFKLGSL
jgi:cytoskeletal protein RodZ